MLVRAVGSELWGRTVWVRAVGSDCVSQSCGVGLCESELLAIADDLTVLTSAAARVPAGRPS